jgi:hypothetical protein
MKHMILALAPLFTAGVLEAQSAPVEAAGCAAEIDWISDYAARNYAGFDVKVNDETRSAYEALLTELRGEAAAATTSSQCDELLLRWRTFFQDGHVSFGRRGSTGGHQESADQIRARFAEWERTDLTEEQARARLAVAGKRRHELEGIWESLDGRYRVALLHDMRDDREFSMTILNADSVWWMPGQTKGTLRRNSDSTYALRFYMLDHSERNWTARVHHNVLLIDQGTPWIRVWPAEPTDVPRAALLANRNSAFAARELTPGTVLVQVPSFGMPRSIDSLFETQGDLIRSARQLIVDLRGNGGGSDFNYRHFLPLIYTDPIAIVSVQALATPENIAAHERLTADTSFPLAQREQMRRTIEQMRAANGGWHSYEDGVHEEAEVLPHPQRVAILVDAGCASSCEQFLLAAKQSRKVTIYGDRSAGILDYGNVREGMMPSGNLILRYPTTRSRRVPHAAIDNVGIQPHVRIPAWEPFPIEWVLREISDGGKSEQLLHR